MDDLALFARLVVLLLAAGMTAAVSYQLLTGRIRTAGLLTDKLTGKLSPERVKLLVISALALFSTLRSGLSAGAFKPRSWAPPFELLALLAVSNVLCLAGKYRTFHPAVTARSAKTVKK